MATMTRSKQLTRPASSPLLHSAVPAPFPRDQLVQLPDHLPAEATSCHHSNAATDSSGLAEIQTTQESPGYSVLQEVMPSIVQVQKSCLTTLNNLLSVPIGWSPIVPDRRHSVPPTPQASHAPQPRVEEYSTALQTLVTNLRNRVGEENMIEITKGSTNSELLQELRSHIDKISSSLETADALLADSLITLVTHFHRLSEIQSHLSHTLTAPAEANSSDVAGPSNPFALLKNQLTELQVELLSIQPESIATGAPPILAVESALLWDRIDEELEKVVSICKERTETLPRPHPDTFPPQYDDEDYYDLEMPPDYPDSPIRSTFDTKSHPHSPVTSSRQMDEKMRMDLEGVTMAIDRLYLVAPQLHNQRVELGSSKRAQLEQASREGTQTPQSRSGKQKEKEGNVQELERIVDLLGKASNRYMRNQSVILEGDLSARLEKARQKDIAKRDALVEQLANHAANGRLHSQDAILQPRNKDPDALLSLPEFIREAVPPSAIKADPQAMLTLPEFVKEPPPHLDDADSEVPGTSALKLKKRSRHRSLSAPSLSWLRSSSKSGTSSSASTSHSRSKSRGINASLAVPTVSFEVSYLAENHENLQHVLVFFTVTGATPGVDIEAEILHPLSESRAEGGDHLLISSGPRSSLQLPLPARILPGKQAVTVQSGHYELRMAAVTPASTNETGNEDSPPLLDATQLSNISPTSFICASCSLPLVHATRVGEYRDLPSEHWQELVDAWMCHGDQTLHEQAVKHGKGAFWPRTGQALVGGSYILFEESCMAFNNLHPVEVPKPGEDWWHTRCLCGAILGRCRDHDTDEGTLTVFRLLKFAIRPVSLTSEPSKIPLSAFIVEDMIEFMRAHATYRFVIMDEEAELPLILIWLFKPSMQIAYTTPTLYSIPKSGSIHVAKVLFKILTPAERKKDLKSILARYPGFPQAEYLYYPMPICRSLAGLLKESNLTYPEAMRVMTGLEVGWLHHG